MNKTSEITNEGLLYSWVTTGAGFVDRILINAFGLVEDVLAESRKVVGGSLDLAETAAGSVTRLARSANGRIFDLASDSTARSLRLGRSVVRLAQLGGDQVAALASDVLSPPPGDHPPRPTSPRVVTA